VKKEAPIKPIQTKVIICVNLRAAAQIGFVACF
jgi:hypothetical protein